jgi:hypothetical protein
MLISGQSNHAHDSIADTRTIHSAHSASLLCTEPAAHSWAIEPPFIQTFQCSHAETYHSNPYCCRLHVHAFCNANRGAYCWFAIWQWPDFCRNSFLSMFPCFNTFVTNGLVSCRIYFCLSNYCDWMPLFWLIELLSKFISVYQSIVIQYLCYNWSSFCRNFSLTLISCRNHVCYFAELLLFKPPFLLLIDDTFI